MAVKIEKSFRVQEPVEKVWAFLSDPRKVVTCVPGAQITDQVDERTYKGTISVKVGPSVTDYKGEVQIVRLDPEAHEIEILGKGQDVRGKGSASMKMIGKVTAQADGGAEVVSVSELNVVGILAQMGSRVINEVSNIMFEKFMNDFRQKLQGHQDQAGASNASAPVSGLSVAFSAIKAAVIGRGDKSDSGDAGDKK
jgi:carbon monoxide dehydrogenase subunit G